MTDILSYMMEAVASESGKSNTGRNADGPGLALSGSDVLACPSMSLLPHIVSVRMYDADDQRVVS
jgi:hypothetical protein